MTTKKKSSGKKPVKKSDKEKTEGSEPLSTFQTSKTGRKDPSLNGKDINANGDAGQKIKGVSLTIEKVKLVKNEWLFLGFSKIEADATTSNDSYENKMRPVHPDCKAAFNALAVHLALLCDYLSTQQIKDIDKYNPDLVNNFHVTSISIGGSDDDQGIVLTGNKIKKDGKAVILNTPFTRFEESEEKGYRYIDDLREKIDAVINEAKEYMNGKRGEDPQGTLDFPETEEEAIVEEDL